MSAPTRLHGDDDDLVDHELVDDEPAAVVVDDEPDEPAERALPGMLCSVTLEGQEPFDVRVLNPDYLRWDKTATRQKWGKAGDVPFLFATFLAWAAAKRTGLTDLPFEHPQLPSWSSLVLDVTEVKTTTADPTKPAHEAG